MAAIRLRALAVAGDATTSYSDNQSSRSLRSLERRCSGPCGKKVRTFKVEIVAPPQLSFQPTSPKMPPRVARSSIQTGGASSSKGQSKHRNPKKAQKRALDAFSIAQHENPDDAKVRKNLELKSIRFLIIYTQIQSTNSASLLREVMARPQSLQ
jgi:hypothetical protein